MTNRLRHDRALLAGVLWVIVALGACSAAGNPPGSPAAGATSPSGPASDTGPDDPGGGIVTGPGDPVPGDPAAGQPTLVMAKPGQANPHPVAPVWLQPSIDGRRVLVKVAWYGGIAPCYVLDSVRIERTGSVIAIRVFEGSGDLTAMCPEIALLKATIVDLGELEPGTYQVTAPDGDAQPLELAIS